MAALAFHCQLQGTCRVRSAAALHWAAHIIPCSWPDPDVLRPDAGTWCWPLIMGTAGTVLHLQHAGLRTPSSPVLKTVQLVTVGLQHSCTFHAGAQAARCAAACLAHPTRSWLKWMPSATLDSSGALTAHCTAQAQATTATEPGVLLVQGACIGPSTVLEGMLSCIGCLQRRGGRARTCAREGPRAGRDVEVAHGVGDAAAAAHSKLQPAACSTGAEQGI